MKRLCWIATGGSFFLSFGIMLLADNARITGLVTGKDAFVNAVDLKPGSFRKIMVTDLPEPTAAKPFPGRVIPRKETDVPQAPAGFKVELYAHDNLKGPRQIRRAPNGDLFVTETNTGEIKIVRDTNGRPEISVFATGLQRPFGVNFYPVGANPQFVYVGNTGGNVLAFPSPDADCFFTHYSTLSRPPQRDIMH